MGACVSIVSADGRHPLPEQRALRSSSNLLPDDPGFDEEADDARDGHDHPDEFGLAMQSSSSLMHAQKQKSASSSSSSPKGAAQGHSRQHHQQGKNHFDDESVRDMRRSSVGLVVDPSVFEDRPSPGRAGGGGGGGEEARGSRRRGQGRARRP